MNDDDNRVCSAPALSTFLNLKRSPRLSYDNGVTVLSLSTRGTFGLHSAHHDGRCIGDSIHIPHGTSPPVSLVPALDARMMPTMSP